MPSMHCSALLNYKEEEVIEGFPTLGFVPGWCHILYPLVLTCLPLFLFMFYLHFTIMLM